MAARILLVGTATDGPAGVYQPSNERDLRTKYGGGFIERQSLSPSASSTSLSFIPFNLPLNEVNGIKDQLYSPYLAATGTTIYFGNIGGSGDQQVDFIYTPYTGVSDLIFMARKYLAETGIMPYVCRIGGDFASYSGSGWSIQAKYAGTKYNDIVVTSTGSSISVSGLAPNYPVNTYTDDYYNRINIDADLGYSPIVCLAASTILPIGSYALSGGTDGSITASGITEMLDSEVLPIDAAYIYIASELGSGIVDAIDDYLSVQGQQPRLFMFPAPTYNYPVSGYIDYLTECATAIPYRHNMICSLVGNITTTLDGITKTRYAAEPACFALSRAGYNFTNLPITAETFTPVFDETALDALKSAGFMSIMRYIKNDVSVYQGTTTLAENSLMYSSKIAEISSIVYDHCYQYLGSILPSGENADIASTLKTLLSQISFIRIDTVSVRVEAEYMYVVVEAFLPDEILEISFSIKNN